MWSFSSRGKFYLANSWTDTLWVFVCQKYGKFWSVLLGHFIKHKPLISEEWLCNIINSYTGLWFFSKILCCCVYLSARNIFKQSCLKKEFLDKTMFYSEYFKSRYMKIKWQWHRLDHSLDRWKNKVAQNEKWKRTTYLF